MVRLAREDLAEPRTGGQVMDVVLLEKIEKLGKMGDVVKVS
jgi:hypothetical protein